MRNGSFVDGHEVRLGGTPGSIAAAPGHTDLSAVVTALEWCIAAAREALDGPWHHPRVPML